MKNKFIKIRKRDGRIAEFDQDKITEAIFKALTVTNKGGRGVAKRLSEKVVGLLNKRFKKDHVPTVEEIQDLVEEVLILGDFAETARAYILYREQRRRIREAKIATDEALDTVNGYLEDLNWEVRENSNMAYSLQGLNNHISNFVTKRYWLNKIYPEEVREAVNSGDFHIHDLGVLATYCCGWDLTDLLLKGFRGVPGKVETSPAKHLRVALGHIVNFFYTLQGETAGAEAFSNFDTLLAPFIRHDKLDYKQVKQAIQEFVYNCNVPTRVGFQTPFTNITMDVVVPENLKDVPVIIGGKAQKENYKEFQPEMDILNKAFAEIMSEGDASGRVFTFPIPTYNITRNFDWNNPVLGPVWEMTARYGIPYFANFVNSEMKPEDARSMCCRLRLDNRELYKRGGGLFGASPLTGSIGVVTINMPRIGYLSKTKEEFLARLGHLMDVAKESLEIKRKTLETFTEKGLYPYARFYLDGVKRMRNSYWGNHFSTIGLIGMNEGLLNFMKKDIASSEGRKFAAEILNFMRDKLVKYQESTGSMYNLEASPGEGTSYRLARIDKRKYPDIIAAGNGEPYYTNSTQLPVDFTDDLFEAVKLQDDLQTKYTGGTVFHGFIGERISNPETVKSLIKKLFSKFHLPYFTITPTFSICPHHGYLPGEHSICPKCTIEQPCEIYSRIVGYLRPVQQWNKGKQQEFKDRLEFKVKK
ncbi:MAG: ribonucleoside triphosphate reductase [Candidatus Portnoybacteria bacterium RBG_13_40_8]|uniref:Ribonucleoside triphosphate reductase n=1 Tax=Candidatus Portnoybacteria bacterium RBG_13_40_8 TaxID=1801990 RepID=A0A1G2F1J0_9BACT|nr:MAG: ribonucleoside triphosphate reductase [Candidatus Portnoybacteria bacterium RBG_13_40_8]